MEVRAAHRFAHISPTKVRPVASAITGKRVDEALALLSSTHRRGAAMLTKVLKSAAANAESNEQVSSDPEEMYVISATVDDGPRVKKWKAGARGRVKPRVTRMSHITVRLTEKEDGD